MEGLFIIPFAGMPGEDIEDTISSVEVAYAARGAVLEESMRLKAMALMLRNAMQDSNDDDNGPKYFLAELDKATLNDFNLLSAKLKERFPLIKRQRRKSRLQFFEDVTSLEQQPTETVQDYVNRARGIAAGIEIYDREALTEKFVKGIRRSGLRISVRTLIAAKGGVEILPFETVAEAVLELADEARPKTGQIKRANPLPAARTGGTFHEDLVGFEVTHQPDRRFAPTRSIASISSSSRSIASRSIASVAAVGGRLRGLRGHNLSLAQLILVVAPSFILFGYNQAGVGGLLSLNDWTRQFPEIDTTHTTGAAKLHNATIQGIVVAVFVLGALVGAFSCMYTGDYFGRRKNIFAAAVMTLIGEAICCSSFSLAQFVIGRTIIGLGIGILSATVPVWQAECSSAANRGKHVVLDGLFITFGYTLESWINLGFFQFKTGSLSWRIPLAIPTIFSLVVIASIFFMPESPRWLILVGRVEDGRKGLSLLKDLPLNHHIISREVEGIQYSLEESAAKPSMMDIFVKNDDKLLYRFCLCILLQFYQQMSGSNLISVYAPVIFQQNLQLDSQLTRILTGGALTWKFLSSFIAFFTIDRYGRRALFIFSGFGMGSCMLALTICTSFPPTNKAASIAGVFFIFMFNFFVPIGFLGANFLYCAEVAPSRLRVSMSAISTANHWLWNFVIVMVTPVAISSLGFKYFIVFTVISFCIPASVYYFFPETMGQSLEQINSVFRDNKTPRAIVKAAKLSAAGLYNSSDHQEGKAERDNEKEIESAHGPNEKENDYK